MKKISSPKKQLIVPLSTVLIILLLSGCGSRQELNTLGVVDSAVYDIKDNTIAVSAEIMNPGGAGKGDSGGQKEPMIVKSNGKSIPEVLRNATDTLGRKVYVPHVKNRFFSERYAQTDMLSTMDFLLRDREIRQTAGIAVIKGDQPENLYKAETKPEDNVGDYIDKLIKAQVKQTSTSVFVDTLEFARDCYEDGKEPVATLIELVKNEEEKPAGGGSEEKKSSSGGKEYKIVCQGFAVFKDNSLVGFMNGTEARAYNLITNKLNGAVATLPFENGETVVDIRGSKSKIKSSLQDGKANIDLNIKVDITVLQESDTKNINDNQVLEQIEQKFDEVIGDEIHQAILKSQKQFGSDSYGFGEYVHIQNPKEWNKVKDDWNRCFSEAEINVKVQSSVTRTGAFKQPFKLEF